MVFDQEDLGLKLYINGDIKKDTSKTTGLINHNLPGMYL